MGCRGDLIGRKFGRFTIISLNGRDKRGGRFWDCLCECGVIKRVSTNHLSLGRIKSCGCLRNEVSSERLTTHGKSGSKIYKIWKSMAKRCSNPKDKSYKNYGGRGIKVCDRWHKFENFYADMGDKPKEMSIDRIDNNGNYAPENCRWATPFEQANNTVKNRKIIFKGKTLTVAQWSRELGIKRTTLSGRLNNYGWSTEKALTTKLMK